MNKIMVTLFLFHLTFFACVSSGGGLKEVQVYEEYSGMYRFPLDMESFEAKVLPPRVIRSQVEFEAFREGIPEYEMTKINPAPGSRDLLLKLNSFDWASKMMLVIFSYDPNRFIDLQIDNVRVEKQTLSAAARFVIPDLMEIHQKVIDYGLYSALVVDRFDGEVVFIRE